MRQFIESSLVLVFAILLTVVIMAAIFPRHLLGGLDHEVESPTILPAVFIDSTHDRPGSSGDATDRKFAGQGKSDECPYLAALAAASKCPAAPERNSGLTCPYLQELQRQIRDVETKTAAPGHHI
jgi:hypothetical protein